jgi:hypothetical protein
MNPSEPGEPKRSEPGEPSGSSEPPDPTEPPNPRRAGEAFRPAGSRRRKPPAEQGEETRRGAEKGRERRGKWGALGPRGPLGSARGADSQRARPDSVPPYLRPQRYGRYIGLLGILVLILITINTIVTTPNGARGIAAGETIPPFAAPLASGGLTGDVNVAKHPDEGEAGERPACTVRGAAILNVCEVYERGPLVLALFVQAGSCDAILSDMQALAPEYPGVGFAAVALRGDAGSLRKLIDKQRLRDVQVGVDRSGVLAPLYKVASCPQVTLVLPGGRVQSPALLGEPSRATLRARVGALVAAARAQGWRQPRR